MGRIKLVLSFIFLGLFIHSCTIDKRVHRSGYHVQWKGKQKEQLVKSFEKQKVVKSALAIKNDIEIVEIEKTTKEFTVSKIAKKIPSREVPAQLSLFKDKEQSSYSITRFNASRLDEPKSKKKDNVFGVLALALLLISTGGLAPVSLILGIIALIQYNKYPGKYARKWVALLATLLSILTLTLIAVGIVLLMGSGMFWMIPALVGLILIFATLILAQEPKPKK